MTQELQYATFLLSNFIEEVLVLDTNATIRIVPKPDWISYETITDVLHDAHTSTKQSGMLFNASSQSVEKTISRLGENGLFYVALTSNNEVVAVGAISFSKLKSEWYGKGNMCGHIKMVGVRGDYKRMGLNNRIYENLENYGFLHADVLEMNTACQNHIVLDSNERHGWKYVDCKSFPSTNYYSYVMAKWKNGCPYSERKRKLIFFFRKLSVHILKKQNGSYRFPISLIKK